MLIGEIAVVGFIPNIAHAQDVWVYGNNNFNVYVMNETYERFPSPANFAVKAKIVYPNGNWSANYYVFSREGTRFEYTWYCIVNNSDKYRLNLDNEADNAFPYQVKIFRYCVNKFQ